jgi:hypothetical protein
MAENIILNEFINKINFINDEKDKNEFILTYNKLKDEFNKIDEIINKESEIDEKLTIQELLNMIKEYENTNINSTVENIDVVNFKKLNDIIELINIKINEENMEINEIK